MSVQSPDQSVITQEELINNGEIPRHIAIIMDGNGRWAKQQGFPRYSGHKAGVESVRDIVESCAQLGVKYLTLYTFSTENWNRPRLEVTTLMKLLLRTIKKEVDELNKNNVRLMAIGDLSSLPDKVQEELRDAVKRTSKNSKLTLVLALSYSGRWEITEAVKKAAEEYKAGSISLDDINVKTFGRYLYTSNIPDPDLLIRTSGELRISNFLLWQIAYSEIYISPVFWPEFRRQHLFQAIQDFQRRERRFGKVSEQLKNQN